MKNKDFIIVLSWPNGIVNGAGSWYDFFFSKNGTYKFGHTALMLIDSGARELYYMDYGRFEASSSHGRIRDKETDSALSLTINPVIVDGRIANMKDILLEISRNESTQDLFLHKESFENMYAKVIGNANFKLMHGYAKKIQNKGLIPYGPFLKSGLTCGRFVYKTVRSSQASMISQLSIIIADVTLRIPIIKNLVMKYYYDYRI